jgi:hypothetical protein
VPSGLSGVRAVAAGLFHSLALKRDGTVVAWGCTGANFGQCSVPGGLSGVTAISGSYQSLALKRDGTVVAWGCSGANWGQCSVPPGLSGVTEIGEGAFHSLALVEAACRVPRVVGKRLALAQRTLARRHCRTGKVRRAHSRKRPKGIVISQSRPPGKVLPARSKINLTVSRGPRP